jgi:hypothetical protein
MGVLEVPTWDELRRVELRSWTVDTLHHAREVIAGVAMHLCPFRIRLFGVLSDVTLEVRQEPGLEELNLALARLRAVFSDEETWCVQYLRDMECHPLRNHYEPRKNRQGVELQATNRITGARLRSNDFEELVRRVTASYVDEGELWRAVVDPSYVEAVARHSFDRMTVDFARRTHPALDAATQIPWPARA